MSVKQFNVKYHPNDDRIVFRFNTIDNKEFILWFTRRVTHIILKAASQFYEHEYKVHTPSVENVISEVKKSDKQKTNYSQAYQPGLSYPLGGETILVIDARCEMLKHDGQDIFSLDLVLPGGANLNIKLTIPVMKGMVMLLDEANVKALWGKVN